MTSSDELAIANGRIRERRGEPAAVDVARGRFPFSLVWTPIPPITWLLPFVGHLGIADSRGVVYDFAGPYYIGVDHLAFGSAARVLELNPDKITKYRPGESKAAAWDAAVDAASEEYCGRMHNIFCDNCHSHVAMALNELAYEVCAYL